jgi:hypothetical protein
MTRFHAGTKSEKETTPMKTRTLRPAPPLRLTVLAATAVLCCGGAVAAVPAAPAADPRQQPAPAAPQSLDDQLARAVAQSDLARTRALLERGANPNATLHEHRAAGTVLHAAALDANIALVTCLLDHGAEPVRHNSDFETPRALAEKAGHTAVADLLRRAEEGTYKPPVPLPAPVAPKSATTTKASRPPAPGRQAARKNKPGRGAPSAAERQAKALKKLNDYNYVKQNFGLGGTTYRSNKW